MALNGYQGQIRANQQQGQKFIAGQEIITLIQQTTAFPIRYIQRIGIQAPEKTKISINNKEIEIGKTGIYEVNNVEITSLKFIQDSSKNVIIDFIVHSEV